MYRKISLLIGFICLSGTAYSQNDRVLYPKTECKENPTPAGYFHHKYAPQPSVGKALLLEMAAGENMKKF